MKTLKELLTKRTVRLIALAVSGILTGLVVCYPALGLLEWFSLIPAALVLFSVANDETNRLRSVYLYGLFFFMCYFCMTWHWFYVMYPMSYTGMSIPAVISVLAAAMIGLPLLQASTFSFLFVLSVKLMRGAAARRYRFLTPLAMPLLWVIFEWTQTLFWIGVPWGRLAIGQTQMLVTAQTASWFGCYFVTFLLVLVNSLLAYSLCSVSAKRFFAIAAAAVFGLNTIVGAVILSIPNDGERVKVAVVQGNISSAEKWSAMGSAEQYEKLTREAAEQGAEIIVWPETVMTTMLEYSSDNQKFVKRLADELDITLLVGTISNGGGGGQYNAIVTVRSDGSFAEERYYKQKLVPFGEYVPWRNIITAIIPALGNINMLADDFDAGEESTVVDSVGSAICFDSIYEEVVRQSVLEGAELIAIETNDSWFYDSPAVYMHLAQARLRAIENGRCVMRAANTGVSALIDANGRIIGEKEALAEGYVVGEVEYRTELTLYTVVGNLFVWLSMAVVVGVLVADTVIKLRKRRENVC